MPDRMKNYGWKRVALANAYDITQLNVLTAQVELEHANPVDAQGRHIESGQRTLHLFDQRGRRKLDALSWAVTYRLQRDAASAAASCRDPGASEAATPAPAQPIGNSQPAPCRKPVSNRAPSAPPYACAGAAGSEGACGRAVSA